MTNMASIGDVADVIDLYNQCFGPTLRDSSELDAQVATIAFDFGAGRGGVDPGVEVEARLSPEVLARALGFPQNLPLLFNARYHKGGATEWDNRIAFREAESSPDLTPNVLHWHQLAGVHATIRRLLSAKASSLVPGILIADEVGLGKTVQSLATIAWLTECVGRQKAGGVGLSPMYSESLVPFSVTPMPILYSSIAVPRRFQNHPRPSALDTGPRNHPRSVGIRDQDLFESEGLRSVRLPFGGQV